jgi:hypothetical protein
MLATAVAAAVVWAAVGDPSSSKWTALVSNLQSHDFDGAVLNVLQIGALVVDYLQNLLLVFEWVSWAWIVGPLLLTGLLTYALRGSTHRTKWLACLFGVNAARPRVYELPAPYKINRWVKDIRRAVAADPYDARDARAALQRALRHFPDTVQRSAPTGSGGTQAKGRSASDPEDDLGYCDEIKERFLRGLGGDGVIAAEHHERSTSASTSTTTSTSTSEFGEGQSGPPLGGGGGGGLRLIYASAPRPTGREGGRLCTWICCALPAPAGFPPDMVWGKRENAAFVDGDAAAAAAAGAAGAGAAGGGSSTSGGGGGGSHLATLQLKMPLAGDANGILCSVATIPQAGATAVGAKTELGVVQVRDPICNRVSHHHPIPSAPEAVTLPSAPPLPLSLSLSLSACSTCAPRAPALSVTTLCNGSL